MRGQKIYALWRGGDASTVTSSATPIWTNHQVYPSQLLYATADSTGLVYTIATSLSATTVGTSSTLALPASTITFGTQAPQANWGSPQASQVDINSGGLTYSYPFNLPPGPGGFTPPVMLTYASGSVAESHNLQAAAPWVGEGWNLSLGSISWAQENVTPGGTNRLENVWNITDATGISGQLIPPDLFLPEILFIPHPPIFLHPISGIRLRRAMRKSTSLLTIAVILAGGSILLTASLKSLAVPLMRSIPTSIVRGIKSSGAGIWI